MNRSIPLSLTFAVALVAQLALGGCSKKEEAAMPAADTAASATGAPDMSASAGAGGASSAPADSAAASTGAMAASK